jgi:KUP system potassium uptake protein
VSSVVEAAMGKKISTHGAAAPGHVQGSTAALALAALGIVFGDIGTSPLYTLKECIGTANKEMPGSLQANTLGVLSLIFWALTMVVTVKYLTFIMRADNRGEGGILALLALLPERLRQGSRGGIGVMAVLVIIGAALLYGDGMITPAISVLSAIEGLEVATPAFKPYVIPVTCAILIGLFAIQSRGTGAVGKLFGPVMVLWFGALGVLGIWHIAQYPGVLVALSPHHAISFFGEHGFKGIAILGGVVLAVTGGEALYADMGHFGARPIRLAWVVFVMPSLVLSYFGQGALVLSNPQVAEQNPFFAMVPAGPMTIALVVLSALATIIASQALISGAFSLTHQAVQLGFFPRVTVRHTSHQAEGQIYVPEINWLLAVACVLLVLAFRESGKLAAAYGIAVTGTMGITSIVYFRVTRDTWKWSTAKAVLPLVLFLSFDLPFFGSNLLKFVDGGYVPILVGLAFLIVMVNWKTGRRILAETVAQKAPPFEDFMKELDGEGAYREPALLRVKCMRVPGTAVFMASNAKGTPPVLYHHAQRIGVLHEKILLLTVAIDHFPTVPEKDRYQVESLGKGFYRIVATYGFMETPDVPALLQSACKKLDLEIDPATVTYYLGRETFLATPKGRMGTVSESLFSFLSRNSVTATSYFAIPSEQVVELGSQIDL